MGEGRVDLNVGFTFSLALSGSPWWTRKLSRLSLLGWWEEPLETESSFAIGGVGGIPFGSIVEVEDW